mmetsp:Transcript_21943/g.49021  ORF Transcript_21943/g.49021 Transcript_21943/m.49021 type:complete len:256 (-) Transcript_21943:234-1001(-)
MSRKDVRSDLAEELEEKLTIVEKASGNGASSGNGSSSADGFGLLLQAAAVVDNRDCDDGGNGGLAGARSGGQSAKPAVVTQPGDAATILSSEGRCPLELFLGPALADEKNRFTSELLSFIKNTEAFVLTEEMTEKSDFKIYRRVTELVAGRVGFTCRYCHSGRDATYPSQTTGIYMAVMNHGGRRHTNCAERPADAIVPDTQRIRSITAVGVKKFFAEAFEQERLVNDLETGVVRLDPNFDHNSEANSATDEVDN